MFRPQKTLEETRMKLYNTLALPALLYGSENWSIEERDKYNNSSREDI
jgi:hypothetical protein